MSRQTIAVSVKASKLTARALAYVVAAVCRKIAKEHRIFAYPKLNIREQMAAYQEVIDRSALNEEKLRLPTSREDR